MSKRKVQKLKILARLEQTTGEQHKKVMTERILYHQIVIRKRRCHGQMLSEVRMAKLWGVELPIISFYSD